jgi:3-oxoacyl-[acyl-carrier protein] reductase
VERFADQVCVVTGGGSGIGAAICRALAAEGGRVAVVELREEAGRAVAEECGGRAYACDVADPVAVREAFARIGADLGPVEVLVNNAGMVIRRQEVQERFLANLEAAMTGGERDSLRATSSLDDETWDRTIRVHLYGTFHCTREALKVMEERRRGGIVNMSSILGLQGGPGVPEYGAAKGAIAAFTKGLAVEVAGAGIRCNAIAPGYVDTPLVSENIDPRVTAAVVAQIPMGELAQPESIAHLALHLLSDEASYTTGQIVSPNGGIVV